MSGAGDRHGRDDAASAAAGDTSSSAVSTPRRNGVSTPRRRTWRNWIAARLIRAGVWLGARRGGMRLGQALLDAGIALAKRGQR